MKIAYFTETYLPDINGIATHIKTLKEGMERLGHDVLIVKSDAQVSQPELRDGVLSCPAITLKKVYGYSLASPVSRKRFSIVKDWDPDVLHFHNEFGQGLFALMAARALHKPVVYTLHTMYDDYLYYIARDCFLPVVRRLGHGYLRFLANRSDVVVGASPKITDYFKQFGTEKDIQIIPNTVEQAFLETTEATAARAQAIRQQFGFTASDRVGCFCGRIAKEKNIDALLRFWKAATADAPSVKLLILGDGPALEELRQLAEGLQLSSVRFSGKIEHSQLPAYYQACDFYITASLSENYSISTLEALASGLPVVHLLDAPNEYQYQQGFTGFTFETEEQLRDILWKLAAQPADERFRLRQAVRQHTKLHSSDEAIGHMLDLYETALMERSPQEQRSAGVEIKLKQ